MSYVLYIEPDAMLAKTVVSYLKSHKLRVKHFTDPNLAMEAADTKKPGVLLVELQLPKYSAIEFLYEFKSYPEWFAVPVIICGIVPVEEVGVDGPTWQQLGIVQYVYKPKIKLDDLTYDIKQLIESKK